MSVELAEFVCAGYGGRSTLPLPYPALPLLLSSLTKWRGDLALVEAKLGQASKVRN
ncbi:MAG: hypothetical protein ACRC67_40920 [Inquilinus sp.]|uniref:hypothetical protein n=1 Tax=Inquilinus sp. TaxID=1932117 RepID=UPI003F3CCE74